MVIIPGQPECAVVTYTSLQELKIEIFGFSGYFDSANAIHSHEQTKVNFTVCEGEQRLPTLLSLIHKLSGYTCQLKKYSSSSILYAKHKNKSAGPDKLHFKVTYTVKICTECFRAFKVLEERTDYTESLRVRNCIREKARGAHSAILLLQLGQVIISHCHNLDYIPKGIKWEMFYQTMLLVFYAFGTCPLKYGDYFRIMKPKTVKIKVGRGQHVLLVSSTLQNYRNPCKIIHV